VNFNSILIGSENPDALVAYYARLFGDPTWNEGGYTGWLIGSGAVTIGPHSEVHGTNPSPGRIIWNIESPDVQADFARFRDAGAIVIREPYTFEGEDGHIATLADPDGNYFQLMSPMPAEMGESAKASTA
jgi:predicted enzyme related to lactoylglutathione lyase